MAPSKDEKARALRELLGIDVKFERLGIKDLDLMMALFGDPATLAERIASGIAKDRVRATLEGLSKEWRPGFFLEQFGRASDRKK